MGDFQDQPVFLDVTFGSQNQGAEAAFPRVLQLSVTDAQQLLPKSRGSANSVLLFAGTARFGQAEDVSADPENRVDESIEIDEGNLNTLYLQLHMQQAQFLKASLEGATAFTALSNVSLDTTSVFGAVTPNGVTELTGTDPRGQPLPKDFWLFSDVFAEEHCGLNRLGYQATALVNAQSLATPTGTEIPIPHHGNVVDLDVATADQVASPVGLDVGIVDGLQVFPSIDTNGANRLLIFTGTAICNVLSPLDDNILFPAVVRVRLRFPVPPTLILKGSATVVGLASIHGNHDAADPSVFGVNAARIVTDPTDGNTLPQPAKPLPKGELYLIADLRAQGVDNGLLPGVNRFAYQANVLMQDIQPDLASILVRPAGEGNFAQSTVITQGRRWEYQIALTSPAINPTSITIQSSDPNAAPIDTPTAILNPGVVSGIFPGGRILENVNEDVIITAKGRRAIRTATLKVERLN